MILRSLLLTTLLVVTAFAADVTGKWTVTFNTQVGEQKYTWDFKAEGPKLTGKYTSSNGDGVIVDGKVDGDKISWAENLKYQDMDLHIEYKAVLSGSDLKITRDVAGLAMEEGTAKRAN
jgi:hypothetical protein